MNKTGIKFVHDNSAPLAVDSVESAAKLLQAEIKNRSKFSDDPNYLVTAEFARHLLWIIGFDTLVEHRKAIREFTEKLVED